jgi:hypothetical protein
MVSASLLLSRSPGFLFRWLLIRRGWGGDSLLMFFVGPEVSFLVFLAQSSDIRKWFMKGQDKNGPPAKPSGAAGDKKKPVPSIPEKKAAPSMVECWPHIPIAIGSALCS